MRLMLKLLLIPLFGLISLVGMAEEKYMVTIDNSPLERSHIFQDHNSHFDVGLKCRITDGDRFVIYRFSLVEMNVTKINLKVANSYKISLSRNGKNYRVFAKTDKIYGGLSNMKTISLNVADYLKGATEFYLKSEHMDSTKPFGGCLFSIELIGTPLKKQAELALINVSRAEAPIKIDGHITDPAWNNAQWAGNFNNFHKNTPLRQQSYAALLYDDSNLYLGFRAYDSRLDQVDGEKSRRDSDIFREEAIEFFVTANDGRKDYYHFALGASGSIFDEYCVDGKADRKWNSSMVSAVAKTDGDRREYEIAIPWKDLQIDPEKVSSLRVNFTRNSVIHGELQTWVPLRNSFHQPKKFAVGMLSPKPAKYGSYGVNSELIYKNPPMFQYFMKNADPAADPYCRMRMFGEDGKLVLDKVFPAFRKDKEFDAAEKALPPGNYLAEFCWLEKAVPVYRNLMFLKMKAEDRTILKAELMQPYFETEKTSSLIYKSRLPVGTRAKVTIKDVSGKTVASLKGALKNTGSIKFPVPEASGKYTLTLSAGKNVSQFHLEKAAPLWHSHKITIDPNGFWLKDGKKLFPKIMFLSSNLDRNARESFNVIVSGSDNITVKNREKIAADNINLLDRAEKAGIMVALHICNLFRGKEDYENLRYLAARLKNHPALAVWYLADEPSGTATSPMVLKKATEILHDIDPYHPVMGCDNSPGLFKAVSDAVDVFSVDPYPIPHNDLDLVTKWIDIMVKSRRRGSSAIAVLQAFGKPFLPRAPTDTESWNMLLQALAGKINGLAWWADGPAHENWPVYKDMLAMINKAEPILLAGFPERKIVDKVVFAEFQGMLLAVNPTNKPVTVKCPFKIPGKLYKGIPEVKVSGQDISLSPLGGAVWFDK